MSGGELGRVEYPLHEEGDGEGEVVLDDDRGTDGDLVVVGHLGRRQKRRFNFVKGTQKNSCPA